MKILLLGEYNSSHYTLKEGLEKLGHSVLVVGHGDGFKNRKVDLYYTKKYQYGFSSIIKKVLFKVFGFDISSLHIKKQFSHFKDRLVDYDVVQLINENPFGAIPKIELEFLNFIFNNNKHVFLLSCGTDYVSVKYAFDKKFRYSILTPYFNNKSSKKDFWHALMYLTRPYKRLHEFVYQNIKGVIASDLDYHIPLVDNSKYLGMAPNPIQLDKLPYLNLDVSGKIIIFHGINQKNYYKKGNDIFEEALAILNKKQSSKIEIITVKNLPYDAYISAFDKAHILLDQVFAYDQGFNALEAMAKGKVVFTGAENEWLDYYHIKEDTIAINALPDAEKIAKKLEWLVLHPEKILEISKNARAFVEKEHHYVNIAKLYLEKWQSKL